MPYAYVSDENRIIEWSDDKLDHMTVEFSNGDYIHENFDGYLEDFIIENGVAVYSPNPEITLARKQEEDRMKFFFNGKNRMDAVEQGVVETQDAIAELGVLAANNSVSIEDLMDVIADLMDAIAELGAIVAGE